MNPSFTLFRKSLAGLALASVITLTGCQKEELMDGQFIQPSAVTASQHGMAIPGQYIVVFKNNGNKLSATGISELSIAGRAATVTLRERIFQSAAIEKAAIEQNFEGVVNGFAARLTKHQLELIRQNPEVAYVEQDRILMLAKPETSGKGNPNGGETTKGGGRGGKNKTEEPAPTEPAPTEPAPVEPTPTEPAPVEPAPSEPAPTEPSYTIITPLPGENVSWSVNLTGYGDGTGKTVWVIDSGIDTDHPDLNVDLARSTSMIYDNNSFEDGYGHGTSVAGIIAAKNNGSGMIGVAANATVVAVRVFDDTGYGTMSRAINAVNYINNNAKAGDVVNMSLGGGISTILDNAVLAAAAKGILFSIASGNSGVDCINNSPARINAPGVYTISAIDSYQRLWSSSNYGAAVDFAAPGVNVTSTVIGGGYKAGMYGTSFAAPHVAGVLLLRGTVYSQGFVTNDKDSWPDPIASVK